jgi:hypothetical protein
LTDDRCLFYRRRFFLPGTAKGNAGEYTRFEAALRAATAHTDIFDLLAVSHVVHKYVETQSDSCQAEYRPVINSIAFLSRTPFKSAIPILVRASFACL